MDESSAVIVSFIGGPAILANACAILQNSAALRHNLSIAQWREFQSALLAGEERMQALYSDPKLMVVLAARRIRLQLRQTRLLHSAACLFAATSFLALITAFASSAASTPLATALSVVMLVAGVTGVLLMLIATGQFFRESAHANRMMGLHALASAAEADVLASRAGGARPASG